MAYACQNRSLCAAPQQKLLNNLLAFHWSGVSLLINLMEVAWNLKAKFTQIINMRLLKLNRTCKEACLFFVNYVIGCSQIPKNWSANLDLNLWQVVLSGVNEVMQQELCSLQRVQISWQVNVQIPTYFFHWEIRALLIRCIQELHSPFLMDWQTMASTPPGSPALLQQCAVQWLHLWCSGSELAQWVLFEIKM